MYVVKTTVAIIKHGGSGARLEGMALNTLNNYHLRIFKHPPVYKIYQFHLKTINISWTRTSLVITLSLKFARKTLETLIPWYNSF